MEQALKIYEQSTKEAMAELLVVLEVEREKLLSERRNLEEARERLELEAAEGRETLESDRAALAAEIAEMERKAAEPAERPVADVSGKHSETVQKSLTAHFSGMFSGRHDGQLEWDEEFSEGSEFLGRLLDECEDDTAAIFPLVSFRIDSARFVKGPDMLSKRSAFAAVALLDNQGVLVVGGQDDKDEVASTEFFNIETNFFSSFLDMRFRRCDCATAVLEDGRVVVVGGYDNTASLSSTEVLSPASNTWTRGPEMDSARFGCAALPLSGSRVLVIGGSRVLRGNVFLSTTEIVDLASGVSEQGPEMSCPRSSCCAAMLYDGRVLVIGGHNSTHKSLSSTEILDLTNFTSSPGPEMKETRNAASAVLLPEDGGILVIGGDNSDAEDLATTEVLDVVRNTTAFGPKLGCPRSFCAAAKLPDNRILVLGGWSENILVSTTEILCMPTEERTHLKRRRLTE